jgi:imidazolonepropionase-like amidohydrolase
MSQILFRNATLIDGTGADPVVGAHVTVEDNRIASVTTGPTPPDAPDATVIDLAGKPLLPGFIDCHTHLAYPASAALHDMVLKAPPAIFTVHGVVNAKITIDAGVTTVRDAASIVYSDVALKMAVSQGLIPGPRIHAAGYGLKVTAGHGDVRLSPEVDLYSPGRFDGPDQARLVARRQIKYGADHIKVIGSGGIMTVGSEPGNPQMTFEELRAVCEVAHFNGKKVMCHSHGLVSTKMAVRAGVDSIEHGSILDDEAVGLMVDNGTFLVPTLSAQEAIRENAAAMGRPDLAAKEGALAESKRAGMDLARAAGVKIAMGTDVGGAAFTYHGKNLHELPLLVDYGLTPMAAIVAATSAAAELLGVADQLGTIKPGMLADLVVLAADPIGDIRALDDPATVRLVVQDGRVVRNDLAA